VWSPAGDSVDGVNVGDSVRHALDHWSKQEWDPAMLHACNAVDETGRKRYPQLGVTARFKRMLRDSVDIYGAMAAADIDLENSRIPVAVRSDLPDGRPDIADVLYAIHRGTHGHHDEISDGFEITANSAGVPAVNITRGKIQLRASAVLGLLAVAVFAPENRGEAIPETYTLGWRQHVFHLCGWWGWQDHFRDVIRIGHIPSTPLDFGDEWDNWKPVD